eukprot:scaffold25837_cov22-Tisochrysis_lutea.AAC.1
MLGPPPAAGGSLPESPILPRLPLAPHWWDGFLAASHSLLSPSLTGIARGRSYAGSSRRRAGGIAPRSRSVSAKHKISLGGRWPGTGRRWWYTLWSMLILGFLRGAGEGKREGGGRLSPRRGGGRRRRWTQGPTQSRRPPLVFFDSPNCLKRRRRGELLGTSNRWALGERESTSCPQTFGRRRSGLSPLRDKPRIVSNGLGARQRGRLSTMEVFLPPSERFGRIQSGFDAQ